MCKSFYSINPLNCYKYFVVFVVVTIASLPCKYINLEKIKISREVIRRAGKENSQ